MLSAFSWESNSGVIVTLFLGLVMFGLAPTSVVKGEPPPRGPLDAIWEKHMLEGTFVIISFVDTKPNVSVENPAVSVDPKEDELTFPTLMSHPISVMKLGEGLFRNGGWVLRGGLLRRVSDDTSTIDLYGKEVVRRFPHFPFPFHRDFPQQSGYEIFLLRRDSHGRAVILRKWVFQAEEVIQKNPNYPRVKIVFDYGKAARSATVSINGLKRKFSDRLDIAP